MAEPLLYRHIVIKDVRTLWVLQCSLSTKRQPNGALAGAWTRKITVAKMPSHLCAAYHKSLRNVILLCPNLESFCVLGRAWRHDGRPEITEDIFKALPDHLRMCAWADLSETVDLNQFLKSCSFFSMLEHLRLRRLWVFGGVQIIPRLPRLRSLSFLSRIATYRIAQWDLPSLVWLEISVESDVWVKELSSFFFKHGKKLEFLQLVSGDSEPPLVLPPRHYIKIPLGFFRYFPLLSCFSVDPTWVLDSIEELDEIPAVPHGNLTTLHILGSGSQHGSSRSCGEFIRSTFVAHQNLFPKLKVISFTINGECIVVPMFYPWFCADVRPTREEVAKLGDEFSFLLIDRAYS